MKKSCCLSMQTVVEWFKYLNTCSEAAILLLHKGKIRFYNTGLHQIFFFKLTYIFFLK